MLTSTGTMEVARRAPKKKFLPRNSMRAKAKPASEQVITWPAAAMKDTKMLLKV